eukprot:TRINITY_DN7174_c0_g1_i4.p4 TRINITY_DN7174_c0_g1~~TRINITY_DN7174_c0_g1_i4.p4  ORF type:complete len:223 (+),score=-13.58 TRINITY_DN7174_c0_g1_i4:332-1000(+)
MHPCTLKIVKIVLCQYNLHSPQVISLHLLQLNVLDNSNVKKQKNVRQDSYYPNNHNKFQKTHIITNHYKYFRVHFQLLVHLFCCFFCMCFIMFFNQPHLPVTFAVIIILSLMIGSTILHNNKYPLFTLLFTRDNFFNLKLTLILHNKNSACWTYVQQYENYELIFLICTDLYLYYLVVTACMCQLNNCIAFIKYFQIRFVFQSMCVWFVQYLGCIFQKQCLL